MPLLYVPGKLQVAHGWVGGLKPWSKWRALFSKALWGGDSVGRGNLWVAKANYQVGWGRAVQV